MPIANLQALLSKRWAVGLAAISLGIILSACDSAQAQANSTTCGGSAAKLTASGSGVATGTPDLLTLQLSIEVTGMTAQAALTDNSTKTAAAISTIKATGVAAGDIQTTGLSIQAHYDVTKNVFTPAGYDVVNSITAKLSDFAKAGTTIDALANNSLRVDSLSFSIKDPQLIQDQARSDAVRQVVNDAKSMAAAAGKHLGPMCSLTENSQPAYPPVYNSGLTAGSMASSHPAVPLQLGTQTETAKVTAVYSLVD